MVVQGAVTPGRTRRLMLKLPVGTLRRNSGERVRHGLPPLLFFPPLSRFSSDFVSRSPCERVLQCCCVCVCKWDLKRFLANPGNGIRLELVEGKSRAKLLISTVDNSSLCFSSCQSFHSAHSASVAANVCHSRPQLSRLRGKSHGGRAVFD